jgi:hypothetical protein
VIGESPNDCQLRSKTAESKFSGESGVVVRFKSGESWEECKHRQGASCNGGAMDATTVGFVNAPEGAVGGRSYGRIPPRSVRKLRIVPSSRSPRSQRRMETHAIRFSQGRRRSLGGRRRFVRSGHAAASREVR